MRPAPQETRPLVPHGRWRRLAWVVRAILRPRAAALSWGAGRLAAGAILIAGVVAQAVFGWRWWVVVIVLTVAGEGTMVASTLARSPERDELVGELLTALAPHRRHRRRTLRLLARFRAAPFPVYGLPPTWTGPRFLAGWATRRDRRGGGERTTSMQLGHGDRLAGPLLLVQVDADAWPRLTRPNLAELLTHSAPGPAAAGPTAGPGPMGLTGGTSPIAGSGPIGGAGAEAGPAAERADIPLDGAPVSFEVLADGRRRVAQGEVGDLVVTLEARDLPLAEVRLVRIASLDPYLADLVPPQQAFARPTPR
jgi:hypothetical protein